MIAEIGKNFAVTTYIFCSLVVDFSPLFIDAELWAHRYFAGMLFVFLTGLSLWYAHQQQTNFTC